MPSRIRVIGRHPIFGIYTGPALYKQVETSCKAFTYSTPVMYASWPRWKRVLWLVKCEGKWKVKVFREPRRAKMRKSLYGREMLALGIPFPPKIRKKNRNKAQKAKYNYGWKAPQPQVVLHNGELFQYAVPGIDGQGLAQAAQVYDNPQAFRVNPFIVRHQNEVYANRPPDEVPIDEDNYMPEDLLEDIEP